MLRRLKNELSFIGRNIGLIGFSAFVCCFFGILLWVNGSNMWYIIRSSVLSERLPAVSVVFMVWLTVYGLSGMVIAFVYLHQKYGMTKCSLCPFVLSWLAYILSLAWYAVFFCTHLTLFASVLLILAILADISLVLLIRKGLLIFHISVILTGAVQVYFLFINIRML